jgi:protease-4
MDRVDFYCRLHRCLCCCVFALALSGCKGGICISTNSKVTAEPASTGPVVPMAVEQVDPCSALKVAVIDVDGLLLNMDMSGPYSQGENPVAMFHERLTAAACDPAVRAVVIRINSPGGGVTASDIMHHDLQAFRTRTGRPVIACLMDVGAGGAYYLATAADQIVAHPTTITGGIGVVLNVYNLADAMAQHNVLATPVKSGDNIDLGSPIKGLDASKRQLLQTMSDEFHARFCELVTMSRHLTPPLDPKLFDGRVFTARQALDLHLINSIGYLDDCIAMARQAGGAPQASVVLYHRAADRAYTPYSITPNVPLQSGLFPFSLPGLDRAKLPTFLYLWQPEPTLEKSGGR